MILTKVSIQGLEDVLAAYGGANVLVNSELNVAMRKSVLVLKAEAKIQAPVGATNVLRSAIYSKVTGGGYGVTGEVGVGPAAPYGVCVHEGTRPHMPPVGSIRQWAERKLGNAGLAWPIAIHISKYGTKANPFMDRAWESKQAKIDAFFDAAQTAIAEKLGNG